MTTVTYANLFSISRSNVLAIINTVSDPISSASEFRKFIYSREPDVKDASFKGYPYIIVHPMDVDPTNKRTLDGKKDLMNWAVEIEIITSDRGYGSKDGQGLTQMDTISDSVLQKLLDLTNRATLQNDKMFFSEPTTTSVITDVIQNELVYRRSILAEFRGRMKVSV